MGRKWLVHGSWLGPCSVHWAANTSLGIVRKRRSGNKDERQLLLGLTV
jgi:hypothetical protein